MYVKVLGLHCPYTHHRHPLHCVEVSVSSVTWGKPTSWLFVVIRDGTVLSLIRFLSKALVSPTNLVILGHHALVLSWALRTSSSLTSQALIMSLSTTATAKMNPHQIGSNCCMQNGFLQHFNVLKLSLHSSVLKAFMNWPSKGKQIYMHKGQTGFVAW